MSERNELLRDHIRRIRPGRSAHRLGHHGTLRIIGQQLPYDRNEALEVHARLFERVSYLHDAGTELGDRYRTANDLAARFVRRLMMRQDDATHAALRRFYRAGQAEKIRLVAA